MSKRILTYNGIDLSTFGTHVSGEGVWAKPAPEFERISVPGRSGDVLLYNGRYSNVDIKYRFGITKNFDTNYTNLIAALLGSPGYHKLVDSKHPGVYRMAAIDKGIEPSMLPQLSAGEFEVVFNCKPQIYLDSGDNKIVLYEDGIVPTYRVTNNTACDCHPLICIGNTNNDGSTCSLTFYIYERDGSRRCYHIVEGKSTVTPGRFFYDSESGNFYKSTNNGVPVYSSNVSRYCSVSTVYPDGKATYNDDITIPSGGYLSLSAGPYTGVGEIFVIPKFCTL